MRTCESRIVKEYKTRKADCMWPDSLYGRDVSADPYPICGGALTITVKVDDDGGDCHCCSGPGRIVIELTCTKCKYPYIPGRLKFDYDAEEIINKLLETL